MTDDTRLRQLHRGLEEAVAGAADDPAVGTSVRRMARVIRESAGISESTRVKAQDATDADDDSLVGQARELLRALEGDFDQWSQSDKVQNVLLVESDPDTARRIRAELASLDFEVNWVPGGEGVMDILRRRPYDLLIVDVLLNDKDGRDLILDVSQDPETARLPIIALGPATGRVSLARSECIALGADVFMTREGAARGVGREIAGLLHRRDPATHEVETSGLLRRARFADRFLARDLGANGGSLALVALEEYRRVAEEFGAEVADQGLGQVARRIVELQPAVLAIGRWAASQIVLLMPERNESEAGADVRILLEQLSGGSWDTEVAASLASDLSSAVVFAPAGSNIEDRMQEAGRVRLGLASEGTQVLPTGATEEPPRSILVVEDDPVSLALLTHRLQHVGLGVVAFADGDQASEAIPGLDFSLAILDVNLPGKDGLQLVREIRGGATGRNRPIIILSGMGSDADIVKGLEVGANDYMLKPFSPIELTARVRRLLEATRRPSA